MAASEAPRGRTTPELDGVDRNALVASDGVSFRDFRRRLTPRWGVLWGEIALGFVGLAAAAALPCLTRDAGLAGAAAGTLAGGLGIGVALAYLGNFFHEAAHWNLAPSRAWNDRLANLLIGPLILQEIEHYRRVHFTHHRHLGMPEDQEYTYVRPLDWWFVASGLTGLAVLETLSRPAPQSGGRRLSGRALVMALVAHGSVLGVAALAGQWTLVLAWLGGAGAVLPFVAALRTLLEHRDLAARPEVDYRRVPHGPVNRLFGDGVLARTLGSAGFNRHLLHHWEPQVPCTRLADLERFLLSTPAADDVRRHRTTYAATFRALLVRVRDV
ncbi:MAG: fatty acid desaturase [bacterium]|nr:fatty acid desaturase [bacterium]